MMNTIGGATTIVPMSTDFGPSTLLKNPAREPSQAPRASFAFPLFLLFGVFTAVYFPAHLLHPSRAPTVEVEAEGYVLSYAAPLASGQVATDLYIARDNTGRCYAGNTPPGWDVSGKGGGNTDLCEARLQQIKAGTCKAVPAFDDEQCHAMPLQSGTRGELRKSRIVFILKEGAPVQARQATQP